MATARWGRRAATALRASLGLTMRECFDQTIRMVYDPLDMDNTMPAGVMHGQPINRFLYCVVGVASACLHRVRRTLRVNRVLRRLHGADRGRHGPDQGSTVREFRGPQGSGSPGGSGAN